MLTQLAHPVSLGDVDDVEAFVNATLNASGIEFQTHEREDLVCEGLVIMFDLYRKFEPHRPGYEKPGRFSGFAAWALPKKIGDAWHRQRPEHRYVTGADGHREWRFFKASCSIEGLGRSDTSGETDGSSRAEGHFVKARYWIPVAAAATAPARRTG